MFQFLEILLERTRDFKHVVEVEQPSVLFTLEKHNIQYVFKTFMMRFSN